MQHDHSDTVDIRMAAGQRGSGAAGRQGGAGTRSHKPSIKPWLFPGTAPPAGVLTNSAETLFPSRTLAPQVTGEEEPMYHARVTVASKVRKHDLPVKNGDTVSIIRTTSCPKGKWLARDANNRCESMSSSVRWFEPSAPQLLVSAPVGSGVCFHCSGLAVCRRLHFSHERGTEHQGDAGAW